MQEAPVVAPRSGAKPQGRRERKKLETRRRIYQAAMALFVEKGFDDTTVEEIAKRADVAKGTVFNYFPHKKSFLHTSYEIWFTQMLEEMGPVDSWLGGARARFQRVFDHMAQQSLEHRDLSRLIIFENMREARRLLDRPDADAPGGCAENPGREGLRLMEGLAREIIHQGKRDGEIRGEVDEELAAILLTGMVFHTLVCSLVLGGSAGQLRAILAAKLDIVFSGLASRA